MPKNPYKSTSKPHRASCDCASCRMTSVINHKLHKALLAVHEELDGPALMTIVFNEHGHSLEIHPCPKTEGALIEQAEAGKSRH